MPLEEADETTWSAVPAGTPGAMTPGCGIEAGASMALVRTEVPSGNFWAWSSEAPAEVLTKLTVQAPESIASGTIVSALVLREKAVPVIVESP